MEKIILNASEDTPEVILDAENRVFKIEGRSLPENAVSFYLPIIEWLGNYGESVGNGFVFHFKLDYFNTASAKQITKVLLILQSLSQHMDIEIKWHYYVEDMDIKSSGVRFAKLIKANIELIPFDD